MELKHVLEFLEIAECENFLEAADNLEMSQSALSKHIQSLEKELGTELFNRTTRKVSLSEGGKIFLPFAREIDDLYHDMHGQLKNYITKDRLELSIGCSPLMGNYGIMHIATDFKKKYKDTEFNLIESNIIIILEKI